MQPNIHFERRGFSAGRFRTGVSLHSHTSHSCEPLSTVYSFARKIGPLRLILAALERTLRTATGGRPLDLSRAYWTPPMDARDAWKLERDHIQNRLGLPALVSLTDHDNIDAPMMLRVLDSLKGLPISVEWTVPYRETFFHLGVHNIRPDHARRVMDEFKAFTACPEERAMPELLEAVATDPAVLVVLNHPHWDEKGLGYSAHCTRLAEFCCRHGAWIHALELNGWRRWKENLQVMAMATDMGKPVISGGDRHGLEPNTTLNLTQASTFGEFVTEVRAGQSEVLFTTQYFEPFPVRLLQAVQDILGDHESHGLGRARWSDRVFNVCDDGEHRALSAQWRTPPVAIRILEAGLRVLRHSGLRMAFRALARSEAPL